MKIVVLAGSVRSGSIHRNLALRATEALREAGVEATFVDLRDFPMPLYDGDLEASEGLPVSAKALKEVARQADGFAIASPEYNGSYPALLKNALDWISRPEPGEGPLEVFRGKVAGILSASPGQGGGKRVLKQLRELLTMMRVNVLAEELSFPSATGEFGELERARLREWAEALAHAGVGARG